MSECCFSLLRIITKSEIALISLTDWYSCVLQCDSWAVSQCGAEETNPCCEAASPGLDNTWPSTVSLHHHHLHPSSHPVSPSDKHDPSDQKQWTTGYITSDHYSVISNTSVSNIFKLQKFKVRVNFPKKYELWIILMQPITCEKCNSNMQKILKVSQSKNRLVFLYYDQILFNIE